MITGVGVLKQFFCDPPLTLDELKVLSKEERAELAELAAVDLGLTKSEEDGKVVYV